MAGARFVDPQGAARIGNLELLREDGRRRVHQRPASRAVLRRVDRLRRASRLRAGRRHPARRLAALRAHRPLLRQAVRGRHQHQLHDPVRHLEVDEVLERRRLQARIRRRFSARASATSSTRQRDRVGIITFDEDIVTHVPPSAKHFDMVLHTLDRAKAERPGHLSAPLHKMAEHFKRRGILLLISDFYDEPGRDSRRDQAAAVPRQRPDRVPRARSAGDQLRLRGRVGVRGPRERRADAGRAGVVPRAVPRADPGAHRRAARRKFSEQRIDYALLNTSEPLDRALFSYLSSRGKADAGQMTEPRA